jgi:hypothetical protein
VGGPRFGKSAQRLLPVFLPPADVVAMGGHCPEYIPGKYCVINYD